MKRLLKYCMLLIISMALMLQTIGSPVSIAWAGEKSLTILFTHDMHDNLLPLKAQENGKVIHVGGYARLMTAINKQKAEDPNALLVDAGDFSMGTPFQTIFSSDAPELRMLGAMGYDVTTFGNHEYDYRPEGLTSSLRAALASGDPLPQIVQSNVTFPDDEKGQMTQSLTDLKNAMKDYGVKDYTILERNGYKIGVFGVMGEEAASSAPMAEVTFTNAIKEAKRVTNILKEQEKVDLILCLSHSGTQTDPSGSEDERLAKQVPDIDVIISGHSHTELTEPIVVGNTVIGSCGDCGRNLGVIQLSMEGTGIWKLGRYQLVQINDSFAADPVINDKVAALKDLVQKDYFDKFGMQYDQVLAESDYQFETPGELANEHKEARIGNLISDAYIYAVKQAEGEAYVPITAAIIPCGTIRNTIFPGNITAADAFSISSLGIGEDGLVGYPIISVYLTGKELKTACEVDASITSMMSDAQLYLSGIRFTFNPNRFLFNKVTKVSLIDDKGKDVSIDDHKLYRIVCGLYSAQMLSIVGEKSYGIMSIVPKDKDGKAITDFKDYIIYENIDGKSRELKEWSAVVSYLQSFPVKNNIPVIPDQYKNLEGRKVVDDDKSIIALASHPSFFTLFVFLGVPVICAGIIFLMIKLIKIGRRNRNKRKEILLSKYNK